MPHVSRKKLPYKTEKQILDSLIYALTDIKDKQKMEEFINSFFSGTERLMFAKRLAIVFLLEEGIGETTIAETLNVTQATVSRIKLWYESKGGGYKIAIRKLKKKKMLEQLKWLALKIAAHIAKSAGGRI